MTRIKEAKNKAVEAAKTAKQKATEIANSDTTKEILEQSKQLAQKTADEAVRTGKKVGSLAKEKAEKTAKVVADTVHSEAEDTKKAVQKAKETVVATTKTAVRTGKKVKETVVATTKTAVKVVDKQTDKYIPQTKKNVAKKMDLAEAAINPLYQDAKRKISDKANEVFDWGNKTTLKIAHRASHKILNKAGKSMAKAAGADPDMPSVIRSTIESTVDNVVKDIKIQMDENLELMIRGTDDEHKEKILADPPDCCRPNPYHWFKAWILYTMFPHDKSIWAQLRNPWYYIFTIISLSPYGVSQMWWLLMFILRDKHDEYQLVNFIVSIKVAGFFSVGVIPTFMGVFKYIECANSSSNPCSTNGPGMQESFQFYFGKSHPCFKFTVLR